MNPKPFQTQFGKGGCSGPRGIKKIKLHIMQGFLFGETPTSPGYGIFKVVVKILNVEWYTTPMCISDIRCEGFEYQGNG